MLEKAVWNGVGIGSLGYMNRGIAKHLTRDGKFRIGRVMDSHQSGGDRPEMRQLWADRGTVITPPDDFAALIGDPSAVDFVTICTGKNRACVDVIRKLAPRLRPETVLIDMSTVSVACARAAAAFCSALGLVYLNVPLTGGPTGAWEATMVILFGGPEEYFNALSPLFTAIGKPTFCGPDPGAGAIAKMKGQVGVALSLKAMCAMVALDTQASRGGVLGGPDQTQFFETMNNGACGMAQWPKAVKFGVESGNFAKGFLARHAAVDFIYAADFALRSGPVSAQLIVVPLLSVAFGLAHVLNRHPGETLATHALVREMHGPAAAELDGDLLRRWTGVHDVDELLRQAVNALPPAVAETVLLDVSTASFEV